MPRNLGPSPTESHQRPQGRAWLEGQSHFSFLRAGPQGTDRCLDLLANLESLPPSDSIWVPP